MTLDTITVTMRKRRTAEKERGGAREKPCDQVGEGSRGFPPTQQRVRAGPMGPSETCRRGAGWWSTEAACRLRNVSCCALPHRTSNPDRNVRPKSLVSECGNHR